MLLCTTPYHVAEVIHKYVYRLFSVNFCACANSVYQAQLSPPPPPPVMSLGTRLLPYPPSLLHTDLSWCGRSAVGELDGTPEAVELLALIDAHHPIHGGRTLPHLHKSVRDRMRLKW